MLPFQSREIYFAYSQFMVHDRQALLCGDWTAAHSAQGFVRLPDFVSFGALLEFGHADVAVYLGAYAPSDTH